MDRLSVGVVGCGWWSTAVHLPAITARQDAVLTGVCDLELGKARAAAERFDAEFATSEIDALLATNPDVVIVATPQNGHFAPAAAAIEAGADVLIEKPMVIEVAEAEALVRASRRAGVRVHVGYPFLYTRHVQRLREVVLSGELGTISLATGLFATQMRELLAGHIDAALEGTPDALCTPDPTTYSDRAHGGGQATSQMSHALGLLIHIVGGGVSDVAGLLEPPLEAVDVSALAVFRTATGAMLSVASCGLVVDQDNRVEEYRLFGDRGHALLDTAAGRLCFVRGDGTMCEAPLSETEIYPAAAPVDRLLDARLGKAEVLAPAELGLDVARVLAAIARPGNRTKQEESL